MKELLHKGIKEVRDLLKKGEITSYELTRFYLDRIKEHDGKVGAYLRTTEETALAMASEADKRIREGSDGELTGIPFGMKDIFCTKGIETTCASQILKGFRPPYDATVVKKLNEGGYVHLGRLNMDEFAMGSSTENSSYQVTKNPWDLTRIPGGSSGGSAAAVMSGLCAAALGTDTGGSIRQPASLCGAVGLKPTYGRVSRYGLVAFASSLDQIGPITRSVEDCAVVLKAIAGHDRMDSTSIPQPVPDYAADLGKDIKGLKIGIPAEYFIEGMDREVKEAVESSIKTFEQLGATVVPVSLPHTQYAVAIYYIIATAEASSNLARYDGVKYGMRVDGKDIIDMYKKTRSAGFGREVKMRIILGTYVLSSGLLRCLLQEGRAGQDAHKARFRRGLRPVRPDRHARLAHHGVQDRREDGRPADHVPLRHFHDPGQPGRPARHVAAVRLRQPWPAHRPADHREAPGRVTHASGRVPFRGGEEAQKAARRLWLSG